MALKVCQQSKELLRCFHGQYKLLTSGLRPSVLLIVLAARDQNNIWGERFRPGSGLNPDPGHSSVPNPGSALNPGSVFNSSFITPVAVFEDVGDGRILPLRRIPLNSWVL